MHIHIDIPRPYLTFAIAVLIGWMTWSSLSAQASLRTDSGVQQHQRAITDAGLPQGGENVSPRVVAARAEEDIQTEREKQFLREHTVEILREQIVLLEREREQLGDLLDAQADEQYRRSLRQLSDLLEDEQRSEEFILAAYNQLREAQGEASRIARGSDGTPVELFWPVDPLLGISAGFRSPSYAARFGFEHDGIDIPCEPETVIRAAADGVVKVVRDNGMGFNSLIIQHEGGNSTLYGHMSTFLVNEGDAVQAGDPIALSDGRPGMPGAGLSTGPHLHFEVHEEGIPVDPLKFLPEYAGT